MNQYIITGDEWLRVYYILPEMAHDIHSHAYQSERDKVLKQLSEHLDDHELKNLGDGDIMIYDLRNWIKRQVKDDEINPKC